MRPLLLASVAELLVMVFGPLYLSQIGLLVAIACAVVALILCTIWWVWVMVTKLGFVRVEEIGSGK